MIVGVTGTQEGPTSQQARGLRVLRYLSQDDGSVLHHGDCVGVDEFVAELFHDIWWTVAHPSTLEDRRAYHPSDRIYGPQPPLDRNHVIVAAIDTLLVVPRTKQEQLRSGTWATYRYARDAGVPRVIVYPDGSLVHER